MFYVANPFFDVTWFDDVRTHLVCADIDKSKPTTASETLKANLRL